MPKRMPMMPPVAAMTTASTRNCSMMSLAARADGHADADLAGAFGDRHEHDVHDADAADQQRDAGDAAEQDRHHPRRALRRFGDVGQIAHGEVIFAPFGDAVALAQEQRDLLLGFLQPSRR